VSSLESGLSAQEQHRISLEQALATLTHRCRFQAGLKLKPEHCAKRKSIKQKIAHGREYPIYSQCGDCQGPIPLGEPQAVIDKIPTITLPPPKASKRHERPKKYSPPSKCKQCGKEPSDEVRFYPSRPDVCIPCILSKAAARRAQSPKKWSPIVEETSESPTEVLPMPPTQPEPQALPYTCEVHGPHKGRLFGTAHSKLCPTCHAERMSIKMKESKGNGNGSITLPDWVSAWAEEQGAQQGIPGREFILGFIGEKIPSEWLKDWLIKRA
jgi:hypothetical protein